MNHSRPWFLALPIAALALGLGGCPIYGDTADDPCAAGGCFCRDDVQCPSGQRCQSNECVPIPASCRTHGDCPSGQYCNDDMCTPSAGCTSDAGCASLSDFICDFRNTCVPQGPGQCLNDAHCAGQNVCVEGQCRPVGNTCQFNYQCGPGRACVDNACSETCDNNAECASGQSCVSRICRPTTECTGTAACGAGEHCVDGRCFADCRATDACGALDACAADEFCRPDWGPEPFCTRNEDCELGSTCVEGVCRTPCTTNLQCMQVDSQFTVCGPQMLCLADVESAPECARGSDCDSGQSCINAICR